MVEQAAHESQPSARPALGSVETEDGIRIEYLVAGDPARDTVLFVHGNAAGAEQFRREVTHYADEFHTLAVSLRGHGGSASPDDPTVEDFTLRRLAADAIAVLNQLGIARAHVVGNSLGGLVALEMLASYPDRVASLVTFGCAAAQRVPRLSFALILALGKVLGRRGLAAVAGLQARRGTARDLVRANLRAADLEAVTLIARNIAEYDYTPLLEASAVPWLLVRGRRDGPINRRLESTLAVARDNPAFQLVDLPDAGHYANLDDPAGFDAAVRPFLAAARLQARSGE